MRAPRMYYESVQTGLAYKKSVTCTTCVRFLNPYTGLPICLTFLRKKEREKERILMILNHNDHQESLSIALVSIATTAALH